MEQSPEAEKVDDGDAATRQGQVSCGRSRRASVITRGPPRSSAHVFGLLGPPASFAIIGRFVGAIFLVSGPPAPPDAPLKCDSLESKRWPVAKDPGSLPRMNCINRAGSVRNVELRFHLTVNFLIPESRVSYGVLI